MKSSLERHLPPLVPCTASSAPLRKRQSTAEEVGTREVGGRASRCTTRTQAASRTHHHIITPPLHYSITPLLHYSITPLLHYPAFREGEGERSPVAGLS